MGELFFVACPWILWPELSYQAASSLDPSFVDFWSIQPSLPQANSYRALLCLQLFSPHSFLLGDLIQTEAFLMSKCRWHTSSTVHQTTLVLVCSTSPLGHFTVSLIQTLFLQPFIYVLSASCKKIIQTKTLNIPSLFFPLHPLKWFVKGYDIIFFMVLSFLPFSHSCGHLVLIFPPLEKSSVTSLFVISLVISDSFSPSLQEISMKMKMQV